MNRELKQHPTLNAGRCDVHVLEKYSGKLNVQNKLYYGTEKNSRINFTTGQKRIPE
jgi:hypothetical protein